MSGMLNIGCISIWGLPLFCVLPYYKYKNTVKYTIVLGFLKVEKHFIFISFSVNVVKLMLR